MNKAIQELKLLVQGFLDEGADQETIFRKISEFLKFHRRVINKEEWGYWGLDSYVEFDPNLTNCNFDSVRLRHMLRYLAFDCESRKMDSYLMQLRDIMFSIINKYTDIECDCMGDTYKILFSPDVKSPVYYCDNCGSCRTMDMKIFHPNSQLTPIPRGKC